MSIPHIYQPPVHNALDIVYQDDSLLIVNKPAGLLSVPGKGEDKKDCLINRVLIEFPEALIVHRLDMATSGLLILARNKTIQGQLGDMFQKKHVYKEYIAVVSGKMKSKQGTIQLPLITDWPNRPKQMVDFNNGKLSVTHYNVLDNSSDDSTLVKLIPVTGRTHQLRVHMHSVGNPIIGDKLYGINNKNKDSERLLLHSTRLQFLHPETKRNIDMQLQPDFALEI